MINDGTAKWEIRKITEAENSANSTLLEGRTITQIVNETLEKIPEKTSIVVVVGAVRSVASGGSWHTSWFATIPVPAGYSRSQCKYWVEPILYEEETYSWKLEPGMKDVDQAAGVIGNLKPNKTYYYLCIAVK